MADAEGTKLRADEDMPDENERVERLFEAWSRRLGRFLSVAAARTREETEDIYAEAQSIRRGERD